MNKNEYFKKAEKLFDPGRIREAPEALKGLKVLELATLMLGPELPSTLAEFGATVIKVELPGTGDTARSITPFGRFYKNQALCFAKVSRNKYHCTLDVRKPEGVEIFKKLAGKVDIVVENVRSGTTDRWGIGYRQLKKNNPKLIYIALTGFGQWGPYTDRVSYDAVAQAETGFAAITGFSESGPAKAGIWIADHFGALMGTNAVLAALNYREKTGKGQFIELSQVENLMRAMDWTWPYVSKMKKNRIQSGNIDTAISPSGVFKSKDGKQIAISAVTDAGFKGLSAAMGEPDLYLDSRFSVQLNRSKPYNNKILIMKLNNWAMQTDADNIEQAAGRYGFAAHRVYSSADQAGDKHLRARDFVHKFTDPSGVEYATEGVQPHLSKTPGRIKWVFKTVGADNNYVFRDFLKLTDEKIEELKDKEIIGGYSDMVGRTPPIDDKEVK
ncbi:MAG: CoA transferase [Epsilonproteobacteria bacterium]|nr:CoA transferase [Campylobacterota bacterium]